LLCSASCHIASNRIASNRIASHHNSPRQVLVGLYEEPERPPNAVDYIKRYMGAPTGVDVEALRVENEELKKEVAELRATQEEMSQRLREVEEADS